MSPGGREGLEKTLQGTPVTSFSERSALNRLLSGPEASFCTDGPMSVSGP